MLFICGQLLESANSKRERIMRKILYGVSDNNLSIMKQILEAENIPLIGYMPNHRGMTFNGKYVIDYWDGTRKFIKEDRSKYGILYFTNNGYSDCLWDLRSKAARYEPIEFTE